MVSTIQGVEIFGLIVAIGLVIYFVGFGVFRIRARQIGILVRKFSGKPMPQGQVIARNGQIGIQADTLPPNLYYRNPLFWAVMKENITEIPEGKIGLVESIDGQPLPANRLLGDEVPCNSFQDAEAFLKNGGTKGPQVAILRPGNYRINTRLFKVDIEDATDIGAGSTGLVTANDGMALPSDLLVAPVPLATPTTEYPSARSDNHFTDGQAFIDSAGYRGPQLDTLQPGRYYINTKLFQVTSALQTEVPPGYVGVLRSNVGKELERSDSTPTPVSDTPASDQEKITHDIENVLVTDKSMRGILEAPLAPGKYNLNTYAYTMYPVPVSAVTVDWASSDRPAAPTTIPLRDTHGLPMDTTASNVENAFFKFNELNVTSQDGFPLEVDVRIVIRILPENAAFVIARFGTVDNLIQQIVHPLIDATFRNNAGNRGALDFVRERTELQQEALDKAKTEFEKYHIEAQNLLISYIDVPEDLLQTQSLKQIALQQQAQFQEQAKAAQQSIDVAAKTAIANKQPEVIAAQLQVSINQNNAMAQVKQAEGIRDSTQIQADGNAYQIRKTGEAQADAYNAQASVIGSDKVAAIKVVDEIGVNHTQITPNVYVQGSSGKDGDGVGNNSLLTTYLATLLSAQAGDKPAYVPKTTEQFKSELAANANILIEQQKTTMQSQPMVAPIVVPMAAPDTSDDSDDIVAALTPPKKKTTVNY